MTDPRNAHPGSLLDIRIRCRGRGGDPGGARVRKDQRQAEQAWRGKSGGLVPAAGRGSGPPGPAQGASPLGWARRTTWRPGRPRCTGSPGGPRAPERTRHPLGTPQAPAGPSPRGPPAGPSAPRHAQRLRFPGTPPDRRSELHRSRGGRRSPGGGRGYIPVVGPTEALRGRAGGPGVDVPPGAVPGLLGPRQPVRLATRPARMAGLRRQLGGDPRTRVRGPPDTGSLCAGPLHGRSLHGRSLCPRSLHS